MNKKSYLTQIVLTSIFSVLLLGSCKNDTPRPTPTPTPTPESEFVLPLFDFEFRGTAEDIIAFEKKKGRSYNQKASNGEKLIFDAEDKVYPQVIYTLDGNKIATIDQPCTKDGALGSQLPKIKKELLAAGWTEWEEVVKDNRADAAFQLIKEIDGQPYQVGTVIIFLVSDYAKRIPAGVYFIFNHPKENVDPEKVQLPWLFFDGIGQQKDELIKNLKEKKNEVKSIVESNEFVIANVDAPGFEDRVRYFINSELNECTSILLTSISFRINTSENLQNQLIALGFEFQNEDEFSKFFYNKEIGLWGTIRTKPATQFSQPNIIFSTTP